MGRLHLIIGPPGSGKTHRLLSEIADEAARQPLGPPAAPPLVLLVPEQQAAQMERAVLDTLATRGVPANSRVQVLSFRWLARRLELAAGQPQDELSDSGRRLLVWKLLGEIDPGKFADQGVRDQTSTLLSNLIGEMARCAAGSAELQHRAEALAATNPLLSDKAALLAEVNHRLCQQCEQDGIQFSSPPARIPQLLNEQNWPLLSGTRFWVDGFSSFTPAEELALTALLSHSEGISASLLLDSARADGPLDCDIYDWYAPSRQQYTRWGELATKANAQFDYTHDVTALTVPQRWSNDSALTQLAKHGLQPHGEEAGSPDDVAAVVCIDERAEVDAAAREVRRLALPKELGGSGLRYGQISITMRSLAAYGSLLRLSLAEHGVPCFVDERRSIAQHPACELLRCGMRMALGCAEADDVFALLKCDLLGGGCERRDELQRRADLLENYARSVRLKPAEWIGETPWSRWPDENEADHRADLTQLDSWRRGQLAPVIALHQAVAALPDASLRDVLEQTWLCLFTDEVKTKLEGWAVNAENSGEPDNAELHRRVLEPIAAFLDELVAIAGDHAVDKQSSLSPAELCRWIDSGLSALSIGFPPPRLDSVLITEIGRGRHHEVAATLLLGMADDSWPPPSRQSPYFSDAERTLLNAGNALIGAGSAEASNAEPYLALVACTRPAQRLWLSRPAADSEGRGRAVSPFYAGVLSALGLIEQQKREPVGGINDAVTAADIVTAAALSPNDAGLQGAAFSLAGFARDALRGLLWARARTSPRKLTPDLVAPLLHMRAGPPELDVRQLEAQGRCPFRQFAQWELRLRVREEPKSAPSLSRFYRRLLSRAVQLLRDGGYDWSTRRLEPIREAANQALAEHAQKLAAHGEGSAYMLERAGWLLERLTNELAGLPAGRVPLLIDEGFGSGQRLDPIVVNTPLGQARIRGRFDRLDSETGRATVVDHRLQPGKSAVDWQRFAGGAELALPAALLATRGHRLWDTGTGAAVDLRPASAEVQRVEPQWEKDEASFTPASLRPSFAHGNANAKLDDLVENTIAETERLLGELAGGILSGEIAPLPLRCGKWTACNGCALRPVCRFDPAVGDAYREQHGSAAALRDRLAAGAIGPEAP